MISLDQLLTAWLPEQRWFAGKGREIASVDPRLAAVLREAEPRVEVRLAEVAFADGHVETYVVPLSYHGAHLDHLAHAVVGQLEEDGRPVWVHDALADRDVSPLWADLIDAGQDLGPVSFHREPDVAIPAGLSGDVLVAEQSNTSLVYGEDAIMKVFRRLERGLNPDVEIHDALRSTDNPHIAPLLGWIELTGDEGQTGTLAMMQKFLPVASDGWSLATASVRDLYLERDLHPEEVGGDFGGEAHRLGAATARVHADLATVLPTEPAGPEWLTSTADELHRRLDTALEAVPELATHADGLRAAYDAVRSLDAADTTLQRVHGDLHLGQALRTAREWVILDFEGEPARSIAVRRTPDSALRDVAGMLRSFDYAARHLLVDEADDSQLEYRAREWADRNRDAFCEGYAEVGGSDPREQAALLRAFEADKAVYEAVYEARNRPTWLPIPLASLSRLSTEGDPAA